MDVDGVITGIRTFKGELTHLRVHPVQNDTAQQPKAKRKVEVLRDILKRNSLYYGALRNEDGDIKLLSEIRVVVGESMAYLRMDDQNKEEDSLPELPKF